jgi:L-ascorbate metabolism protein UlaG (beta-lactamase superfamily)
MNDLKCLGCATGFIIRFKNGVGGVYHAGDTNVFLDMQLFSELYEPKYALLPIGGNYTMGPLEAAYAAVKLLTTSQVIIPMHYGTFPVLTGNPTELREEVAKRGQPVGRESMEIREM